MRRVAVAALLLALWPGQAGAWESPAQVIHGTARVLEKGETVIGVLSPMAFGIHERVTLFLHPALYLFLTPNFWVRASVYQRDVGVSLEGGYEQSFLAIQQSDQGEGTEYPGMVQIGGIVSWAFARQWQVTLATGYLAEFSQGNRGVLGGLYGRLGADFLITSEHLIMAELKGRYLFEDGWDIPTFTALYARQFGRMRIGAGFVLGEFSFATTSSGADTSGSVKTDVTLPVYPWVDAWWRF